MLRIAASGRHDRRALRRETSNAEAFGTPDPYYLDSFTIYQAYLYAGGPHGELRSGHRRVAVLDAALSR